MDTDKIIQNLNRRFEEPLPEFYKRRIIFQYDEDREVEDKIEELELANALQVCLDSGTKKILMPAVSMLDLATVPADLSTAFDFILYKTPEEAVIKALGAN